MNMVESRRKCQPPETNKQTVPIAMKSVMNNYDAFNVWVDSGDFTTTIDPTTRFTSWLRPGQEEKHFNSLAQERYYTAADTIATSQLLDNQQPAPRFQNFSATYDQLMAMPRYFSAPDAGSQNWRGQIRDVRGAGRMPVIKDQHERGALAELRVSKEDVERMQYLTRFAVDNNVADRSGFGDHSLPIIAPDTHFSGY